MKNRIFGMILISGLLVGLTACQNKSQQEAAAEKQQNVIQDIKKEFIAPDRAPTDIKGILGNKNEIQTECEGENCPAQTDEDKSMDVRELQEKVDVPMPEDLSERYEWLKNKLIFIYDKQELLLMMNGEESEKTYNREQAAQEFLEKYPGEFSSFDLQFTRDGFTLCEEKGKEECAKNYYSFSKIEWLVTPVAWKACREDAPEECIDDYQPSSFSYGADNEEVTEISCKQGFTKEGNCRLGYFSEQNKGGKESISCDHYFNGKCYGLYEEFLRGTTLCWPADIWEVTVKKSDFDNSWGYYKRKTGCEESYDILCTQYDPVTNICKEGTFSTDSGVYEMTEKGWSPYYDVFSCEIKDGKCLDMQFKQKGVHEYVEGKPDLDKLVQKSIKLDIEGYSFE